MRKDKLFVKARSRGADLGSQRTDSQGKKAFWEKREGENTLGMGQE